MSPVGDDFIKRMGAPNPRTDPDLRFKDPVRVRRWNSISSEIGAGWYVNRFYYLFGGGLNALRQCLDVWDFLVPRRAQRRDRIIIGRNAYGAIILLENPDVFDDSSRIHIVDPLDISLWTDPDLSLMRLVGYAFPNNALPYTFRDASVYEAWVKASGRYLEPNECLGIKVPLSLGGTMTLDNFQVEDIVEYYKTTAPILAAAYDKAGRPRPPPPATSPGKPGGKRK